ncbi:putative reverse transcriptase domain-containing protein, partial [Tanacetum coccineum]
MKYGPTQFHRTEGAVGLCQWFEKKENTFEISECAEGRKVATLGREVVSGRPWTEVKQMMIDEFCPIEEVQRLEDELRHLKLKDMNIAAYTERFNEFALLCPDAVPNKNKKVELYIKGLPEIIKGETTSSGPAMINEVVRMAHALMEQKIQAKNERIAEGIKRKWETIIKVEATTATTTTATTMAIIVGDQPQSVIVVVCVILGIVWRTNRRGGNATGHAYALRDAEQGQGPNVVTGTFLLNNRYARVLFDSGSDKSFVSSGFSQLIDIKP